jgi:hypothetical protein
MEEQLAWRPLDTRVPACSSGWCEPTSIARVGDNASGYTRAIAAVGAGGELRTYFINVAGKLSEVQNVDWGGDWSPGYNGTGWYSTYRDILAEAWK